MAMQVFVQVVDCGGFTRAADQLQMPKATVSTLIQQLESALGVKLLNRTTRQVHVTADGAGYYERCLRILADVRDTEEALTKVQTSPSGRLRVEVPSSLGRHVIIPALPGFFKRYPSIRLQLGCSDRPVDLLEEGVDCAVRGGLLADSTLIARRVGALHFTTCAAPDYLARHGTPSHPSELAQHQCVNYFSSRTGKIFEWDFERDGERVTMAFDGPLAVNDSDAYVAAGLAGMGIVQMSSYAARVHQTEGLLVPILSDWHTDPIPLHVIYPQNRHLSAKVRVFVEWIAELFVGLENQR